MISESYHGTYLIEVLKIDSWLWSTREAEFKNIRPKGQNNSGSPGIYREFLNLFSAVTLYCRYALYVLCIV